MSCVLVLLRAIVVMVVIVVWGYPCPPFISKGVGLQGKSPGQFQLKS
jgi:hypothetical protein